ncbi:MAG: hypothetical protein ACLQF1_09040 [Methyloceanibacter sp.]
MMVATLQEIRKHVLDDADEVTATTGMVVPLLRAQIDAGEAFAPHRFLRRLFARHVILILMRLHEEPGKKRVGETASIASLLERATADEKLSPEEAEEFQSVLGKLVSNLEVDGVRYSDLKDFRVAELAHSVHPRIPRTASLPFSAIWRFAHDTFEVVLAIDQRLKASGCPSIDDLEASFDVWIDRGDAFWASRINITDS